MKLKLPLLGALSMSLFAANAQTADTLYAEITFNRVTIDTGKIGKGPICVFQYQFKNTGNQPLIISYVHSTCSCVETAWSKETIAAASYGTVTCSFETSSETGSFNKSVLVYSNDRRGRQVPIKLSMKGYILK